MVGMLQCLGLQRKFRKPSNRCSPEAIYCSKLAFVLMFLNISGNHNVPNVFVSEMLAFLHKSVLPQGNLVPKNMYEAKRLISSLGLNYDTIHACPDGHVLFRKEHSNKATCPVCGKHRYLDHGKSKQPAKVLRHFPIIPRLQRMFRSRAISELMRWTSENKSTDGQQRHIGDSKQWKGVDVMYTEFAKEARNVRLGLSLDGVNPFGEKHNTYSCWPVTLLNYNLPPWLTTKRFFVMLALLIPGPDSVVAAHIDVFLAPLVEELRMLWLTGVLTYDVLQRMGEANPFVLRAIMLLTIADYPAHSMIAGQVGKGYLGCTRCGPQVTSHYSKSLKCMKYLGHRRFLPSSHPYRTRANLIPLFDGRKETRGPPSRVNKEQLKSWGAAKSKYDAEGGRQDGPKDPSKLYGLKRHTIMDSELEYWRVSSLLMYSLRM